MCSGDVLVVQNMMCLGRNKQEIKQEWETFIEEKIDVVILRSPVIDTRMLYGTNSDEQCVSKAVLSCMMDEEQSRIRSAQREEIENAKKQGKFKGRERKYHPDGIGEEKTVYETIIN
ncbi:recombinase family protein [Staphylococcus equorum]|uniref:recombinase family protein n=1 Tax=Staphylococcus equorum TaxID=246432 RepID=UPI003FD7BDE4